ncbi:MAG: SEL1-like repeat protein, partial [Bdellovibrionales bacterium]|nr:SEL1-like repeat protein [Bdellovibrionales bacterium]
EEELDSPEDLYVLAYPGGKFQKINQTSVLKWNSFSSDNSNNHGASGGPVLDKNHNLVGIVYMVNFNLLSFIEIENLKKFLEKDSLCKELNFKGCIKRVREDFFRYLQGEKVPQDYYKIGMAFQKYEELGVDENLIQEQIKKWFEISAKQDNALAQHGLAEMYYKGLGTEQDLEKSRKLLEESAKQGYAPAQYTLARIEKDVKKSREWFEISAKQGYVLAQYKLAEMYFEEHNLEKSREWFEKAINQ